MPFGYSRLPKRTEASETSQEKHLLVTFHWEILTTNEPWQEINQKFQSTHRISSNGGHRLFGNASKQTAADRAVLFPAGIVESAVSKSNPRSNYCVFFVLLFLLLLPFPLLLLLIIPSIESA
ncbi:hypothetical protein CEXT_108321 [Caerostris extrusa]|uniref:Uncharacterized protein n=1 Tax=Caerostris extrusa TaxID=172846 RepID=A0AAV4RB13_CAEEX|nr:hypothetical protein CEXT_108321 [Caerostris extrusa]